MNMVNRFAMNMVNRFAILERISFYCFKDETPLIDNCALFRTIWSLIRKIRTTCHHLRNDAIREKTRKVENEKKVMITTVKSIVMVNTHQTND
uniref:Uncharacterized protein n=1 Tax=Romanomermis culicivorax TaxID=13658 RepID=A0A915JCC7_ROMCU